MRSIRHRNIGKIYRISLWVVAVTSIMLLSALVALRMNGYELLSVQTNSMAPAIQAGEAVVVTTTERDLAPGDIVSFTSPQNSRVLITHRVVSVDWNRGTFIAQGDSNDMTDRPVPIKNLRGTVVHAIPIAGLVLNALRHPLGVIIAVYLPAAGIIAEEVRRLTSYYAGNPSRRFVKYSMYGGAR